MVTLREWGVLWQLVRTDLKIIKYQVMARTIDAFVWVLCMIIKSEYLLPLFGISKSFGAFVLAGSCATAGQFAVWTSIVNILTDISGDRVIAYYATLPIPSWMVFLRIIISNSINAFILGLFVLPLGKIFLGHQLDLASISIFKFALIYVLISAYYGAFALWLVSFVSNIAQAGSIWMRVLYPLWILGAFEFSWKMICDASPVSGYVSLLNPYVYVMEGMRGAVLNWPGSIPYWYCVLALTGFVTLLSWHGIMRIKKRLDFV